jgi:hypothetical protein
MAGDWIKMRADLHTHPKVVRIASALKADRLRVVGGLHAVWCLFDVHSVDGYLEGYGLSTVDDLIGWGGFAEAMKAVGWLEESPDGLTLPEFDTHNGQSAKRRAQDSERKRVERASASDADKKRTREEKRREEKSKPQNPNVELPLDDDESEGDRDHDDEAGQQEPPAAEQKRTRKATTSIEDVEAVFDYWKTKRQHPRAKLDAKREKKIRERLADGYTVGELCQAVDGIAKSRHHMGDNDTRTIYDDIELICRDASKVDKFIRLASAANTDLTRAGASTAAAGQRWLNRNGGGNA